MQEGEGERNMEEAHEVLIQALKQAGVQLSTGAESVQNLSSSAELVAICSRALALIHGDSAPFPPSFPASVSDRIRLCTEIASSIKHLGFKGDLSFHQFLYPLEEETHRLLWFLLDKISSVSDTANDLESHSGIENLTGSPFNGLANIEGGDLSSLEEQLYILSSEDTKLTHEIGDVSQHLKSLNMENEASSKHLKGLIKEKGVLSAAVEMALDSTQTEESKLLLLKSSIEQSQKRLLDSRTEWESILSALENKRALLESSVSTKDKELHLRLQELKIVRHRINDTMAKLQQREEQNEVLAKALEKIEGPSRSSYVIRITELIKNSKKQDTDILRILGETRELQRESNMNQERLKRTYALVDELVFRDAKKDATSRQAYRLLTTIHENFAACYDSVFALNKLHREIADFEVTLEAMEKRPIDLERAEADFHALVSENLSLEKALQQANMKNKSGY